MPLRTQQPRDQIPTSSMSDVAFLLVIYFMVTVVLTASKGLDFKFEPPNDHPLVETSESVLVEIDANGALEVDRRPMAMAGLLPYLEPKLKHNPTKPVIIRPADDAPYGAMVAVYDELRRGAVELGLDRDIAIALPTSREIETFWL